MTKLKILKAVISDLVTDSTIIACIQDEIDRIEEEGGEIEETSGDKENIFSVGETDREPSESDTTDLGSLFGGEEETETTSTTTSTETEPIEAPSETVGELPSPDSLGIDFTQNQNF